MVAQAYEPEERLVDAEAGERPLAASGDAGAAGGARERQVTVEGLLDAQQGGRLLEGGGLEGAVLARVSLISSSS